MCCAVTDLCFVVPYRTLYSTPLQYSTQYTVQSTIQYCNFSEWFFKTSKPGIIISKHLQDLSSGKEWLSQLLFCAAFLWMLSKIFAKTKAWTLYTTAESERARVYLILDQRNSPLAFDSYWNRFVFLWLCSRLYPHSSIACNDFCFEKTRLFSLDLFWVREREKNRDEKNDVRRTRPDIYRYSTK